MSNQNLIHITSRSQHSTRLKCQRMGMIEYDLTPETVESMAEMTNGTTPVVRGLRAAQPGTEVTLGSAVHAGIDVLVKYAMLGDGKSMPSSVVLESAVLTAHELFDSIWNPYKSFVNAPLPDFLEYQIKESRAMVEALIAVFYYHPQGLSNLVSNCTLVAFEEEIQVPLGSYSERLSTPVDFVFQSRPDLVIRMPDGKLHTIDFKTAREWDQRTMDSAKVDHQGISQALAVQYKYNEESSGEYRMNLIKGSRRKNVDLNIYVSTSPLLTGYLSHNELNSEKPFSLVPLNKYSCAQPHMMKQRKCSGGKNHLLGDDWMPVNIYELDFITIREWVGQLFTEYPELSAQFLQLSEPIYHPPATIMSWVEQLIATELRAIEGREQGLEVALNTHFPQNLSSCIYPYKCSHHYICHGMKVFNEPSTMREKLVKLGYVARQNHHTYEETNVE